MDGIDAALIETDGHSHIKPLGFKSAPFAADFRAKLRGCLGVKDRENAAIAPVERQLTELHAEAVKALLKDLGQGTDIIGFHGQTVYHCPAHKCTIQIGDGALLAKLTGIDVVNDFRAADVQAGGQGAPLVPLYHRALMANVEKPVLILNIGGVSNITWIGGEGDDEILACDVGPGNALIDDWVLRHTGKPYDKDGALAASGKVYEATVEKFLGMPFFRKPPPKSLDRDEFSQIVPAHLSVADGAATLTMLTAKGIAAILPFLPLKPQAIYVGGGGRHNATLMRWIAEATGLKVLPVDNLGWRGDALEAEAFAWLAVRSVLGLPLSLPTTTGVSRPMTGGKLHKA